MSMNRLAIVAAIGTHNTMKNRSDDIRWNKHPSIERQERPSGTQAFNGDVNVLLGGAMFSVVISIVCFLCYCCHQSLKRRDIIYQQRWMHVDPNMDIYSVEQYYDISTNNGIDDDQYTQILRNHGPPPAYEIAVNMKSPLKMEVCHLCQNKVRVNCMCDTQHGAKKIDNDKAAGETKPAADQLLNVKNISQHQHFCDCQSHENRPNTRTYSFDVCNDNSTTNNVNLCDEDIQNGNSEDVGNYQCTSSCEYVQICRVCGKESHVVPETSNGHDINDNVPSTSGDGHFCDNGDINSNYEESDEGESDGGAEFDSLNENGLIRVDMRKLIDDQTGLPTYEAALKLESSGYV